MPSKRTVLDRPRTPAIDAETVALFKALNAVPLRRRESPEFEQRAYALAQRLGLGDEHFCSRCSVLDRERAPCWPPEYYAHGVWHRVRAIRLQLLEMTGLSAPDARRAKAS
jgi:hypothetical protein